MRAQFLSLLLVFCTLLASYAAPIDIDIDARGSGELGAVYARKAKTAKPVKAAPKPKPVKAAPKPVKAAPKPAPKPPAKAAPKPAPKPKPAPAKAAPKPPAKAAPKPPAKAAPKPAAKPKPKPAPAKAAPKPPAKAAPKPAPTPAKAKTTPKAPAKAAPAKATPAKAAKTTSKPPAKAAPAKAAPPKASKAATTSKGAKACPIPKKGSKVARVTGTEDCPSPAELCAELGDDCNTCVGAGLQCAFDVKGNKCVPEGTTGLTLATDKKSCTTLIAAQKAAAPPAVDPRVTTAAQGFFSSSVQDHIFKGTANKKTSGRHILSAWTKANPTSKENKRNAATGVVEFQNGDDIKTVWNDVKSTDGTVVYTQAQIKALCLRGYELSILKNPSNAAALKADASAPAASTSKKGKGKAAPAPAALKLTSGLNNGFVVHNPVINQNVCLNINSASCFPLGTGTASGNEGDSCTGDANVED